MLREVTSEDLVTSCGSDPIQVLRELNSKKSPKDFDKLMLEHFSKKGGTPEESNEDSWLNELHESLDKIGDEPQKDSALVKEKGAQGGARKSKGMKPEEADLKPQTSRGRKATKQLQTVKSTSRSSSAPRAASAPSLRPPSGGKKPAARGKLAKPAATPRGRKTAAVSEAPSSSEEAGSTSLSRPAPRRGRAAVARGRAGASARGRKATSVRGRRAMAGQEGGTAKATSTRGARTARSTGGARTTRSSGVKAEGEEVS